MSSVTAPQARNVGAPQAQGVSAAQARNAGAAPGRQAPRRSVPTRPPLQVVPAPARRSARAPFVALVVALLGGGLVALLLLNTALAEGAFVESSLERRNATLADREQQLERKADRMAAPQALADRARELGMVPGGPPAFLDEGTGKVSGDPQVSDSAPVESAQRSDGAAGDGSGAGTGTR